MLTPLTLPITAVLGAAVAAVVLLALLADQERRWRRSEQHVLHARCQDEGALPPAPLTVVG